MENPSANTIYNETVVSSVVVLVFVIMKNNEVNVPNVTALVYAKRMIQHIAVTVETQNTINTVHTASQIYSKMIHAFNGYIVSRKKTNG